MKYKHTHTKLTIENEYPKLVRDKIPEIVEKRTGQKTKVRIIKSNKEFQKYLKAKIQEEAEELKKTKNKIHLAEEITDIQEVLEALMKLNNLGKKDIERIKFQKNKERGAFRKRILMLKKT